MGWVTGLSEKVAGTSKKAGTSIRISVCFLNADAMRLAALSSSHSFFLTRMDDGPYPLKPPALMHPPFLELPLSQ